MNTDKKTRVGVIGVGHLGNLHAKMYDMIPSADFIGIYDIDMNRSKDVAERFGVTEFPDIDTLLANVEAVSVVTPTSNHFETASYALNRGVHVFIEKPITSDIESAEALINLAREKDRIVQVGHIERFNPALMSLKSIELNPMFIESHRLAQFNPRGTDVAVVLDLMIHDLDIILSLIKSPVKQIDANGVAIVSDSIDIANTRIQFENGAVANITASRISQKKMRKMRLFQRDTYITIDFLQGLAEVYRLFGDGSKIPELTMMLGEIGTGDQKKMIVYQRPEVPDINALEYELAQFVDSVRNGTPPLVTGDEGKNALKVALEVMEKIKGQTVPW
jgi:predicted dehydrogenase